MSLSGKLEEGLRDPGPQQAGPSGGGDQACIPARG